MKPIQLGGIAYVKERNKRLILRCVKEEGPVSRSEIADRLQISKPTVSALVEELLREGWVQESGIGHSGLQGGRRPIELLFNNRAAYVIGVDIGGTKVRTGICDLSGKVVAVDEFPTQTHLLSGILTALELSAAKLMRELGLVPENILGMGIGAPGMTDVKRGIVLDAPSLGWKDYELKKQAEAIFPWPVVIDNDVNVAVIGEQWIGAAKGLRNVVLISIGTGIGCGLIIHGELYRGSTWAAGEIGYMITDKTKSQSENLPAYHKGYGFLDRYTGGPSIVQKMEAELKSKPGHFLSSSPFTAKDVFHAAQQGDETALGVVHEVVDHIGFAIANMISIINPEVVLLGGGVSKSADWFMPRIKEIITEYASVSAPVKRTAFAENLGVVGAVSLVLREIESALKVM
ncbi:ROK family transcriptional regulator [Bacillus sp. FJAT-42376]|uniref:ROK family transcriptional regulator n=1 Tax=Bacillus sp. FJAT-42376 TaxID=2014076 RepID=UPI000F4EB7D1|nr:ROK family transcriptional regulator [Bacillus sp. FJAT-42376]AZB44628.1 ROK family transcriptional regulator [Bacillus sp. FJAT-42376]